MDPSLIIIAGAAILGSGGAAWAGTKASLNGTRNRVNRIENRFDESIPKLRDTLHQIDLRTARIEERVIGVQDRQRQDDAEG